MRSAFTIFLLIYSMAATAQSGALVWAGAATATATAYDYRSAARSCADLERSSARACTPPADIQLAMTALSMAMQQGDIKSACSKMGYLSAAGAAIEGAYAQKCASAAGSCQRSCETLETWLRGALKSCEGQITPDQQARCTDMSNVLSDVAEFNGRCAAGKTKSIQSYIQAGVIGFSSVLNFKCASQVADKNKVAGPAQCYTEEQVKTNPLCGPLFCAYPENKKHPVCSCDNPNRKNDEECYCAIKENKSKPRCLIGGPAGIAPPTPKQPTTPLAGTKMNTSNPSPLSSLDEDINRGLDQQYNPSGEGGISSSKVNPLDSGPGGGVSAFGGGSGMGGGQAGGAAQGPYNTDINKGYTNGGGGGFAGGGGGYAAGPTGGYGESERGEKMDWKSLLPKVEKNRGPSGVDPELFANGITGANGLSNFEKVTRKMNEKRPTLLP